VSDDDVKEFISERGKGWVAETDNTIIGFAIADLKENSVWALFVHPLHDKKGAGKKLHELMLNWYFEQTKTTLWLGTSPNTRAEIFYRKNGWIETGMHGSKEIKFEMTFENRNNILNKNIDH
jgi:GNAT superfamily N-acetyltransferase